MNKLLLIGLCLTVTLLTASGALAVPPGTPDGASDVPGEVLVKFKNATPQSTVNRQLAANGARVTDRIGALDVLVLKVPPGQEQRVISALSNNPDVEYAEPNYVGHGTLAPRTTLTSQPISGALRTWDRP